MAQVSIRDIKPILNKYGAENPSLDSDRPNYLHDSDSYDSPKVVAISSRAYELFSKGQSPLEVSIALNIEGPKALRLYKEYNDMKHMGSFSSLYESIGDDLPELHEFFEEAKRSGMSNNQILEYLRTYSFDLPAVQEQYEALTTQTEALRLERNADRAQRREIESQINTSGETLRIIIDAIKEGQNEKWALDRQKAELKRFVTKFRDTDQGYSEITQSVKTRVKMILKDKSRLLDLAVISVLNSLSTNKDKCKYLFELLDLESHGQNRGVIGWDYFSNTMKSTPLTQYKSNPFLFSKGLLGAQSIGYGNDPNAQRYKDDIVKMSEWFYERLAQDLTVDILKQLESSGKSTYI